MRFSPLFRKIDVVIIPSKFEQNRPVQSWDIAWNLKSKKNFAWRFFITLSSLQARVGKNPQPPWGISDRPLATSDGAQAIYHVLKVILAVPKVTFWHPKWPPKCTNWFLSGPSWPNSCLIRVQGTLWDFINTPRDWIGTLGDLRGSLGNLMGTLRTSLAGQLTRQKVLWNASLKG